MSQRSVEVVPAYSDQDADVILLSDDGKKFRVHSYYLKAFSSFFRDMLSSPLVGNAPISSSQTEPMPIAASADDLVVLLDTMTKGGQAHPVDVKQWARLADITRKFGCDVLLQFIIRDLNENISQHPWLVFCAASRLDDIKLATNAIKAMKDDKILAVTLQNTACNQSHWSFTSPLSKMTQEYWQGCHGDYYFAFVKSVAQYEEEGVAGRYAWETVGNKMAGNMPKVLYGKLATA